MSIYDGRDALVQVEKLKRRTQELENEVVVLKSTVTWLREAIKDVLTALEKS